MRSAGVVVAQRTQKRAREKEAGLQISRFTSRLDNGPVGPVPMPVTVRRGWSRPPSNPLGLVAPSVQ